MSAYESAVTANISHPPTPMRRGGVLGIACCSLVLVGDEDMATSAKRFRETRTAYRPELAGYYERRTVCDPRMCGVSNCPGLSNWLAAKGGSTFLRSESPVSERDSFGALT